MKDTKPGTETLWTGQFLLLILANFNTFIVHFILLVSMPLYILSMGGSNTAAGLSTGIYSFAALMLRPTIGYVLDTHGRKKILVAGLLTMLVGITLINCTESIILQLFLRLLQGVGFSIISTAYATMVTDLMPKSRLAEGMGYYGVVVTLTNAVGPFIGLLLIDRYGYDVLFPLLIPLLLVAMSISLFFKKDPVRTPGEKKPPIRKTRKELVSRMISLEKTALPASAMMVFAAFSFGGIITFLASYGYSRGIEDMQFFFVIFPCAVIFTRLFAGRLSDRYGYHIVIIPCTVLAAVALFLTAAAGTVEMFVLVAVLYGLGYGTLQPTYNALAVRDCPAGRRGGANATFYISLDLGVGTGSILLGYVADELNFSAIYIISGILVILSLVFFMVRRKMGGFRG